ncbi:MAG TPA: thioesterase family protein [Phycisphaerales bacterium]|nr:thioesterase family protein [Phycisphaerales bacterium]HRQ75445.1 thioesterase family protein [Phycisphaerales bacterium]
MTLQTQPTSGHLVPLGSPIDWSRYDVPHHAPFQCHLTIAPSQISDTIPHVSNIEYVRWLDRAAELHSDACSYTRQSMLDAGVMWFVARHEIDYLAETWLDDHLLIATWVRQVRRVKAWREYVVVRPADETVICRAATLWVLVDLTTRRPTRIPEIMAKAFAPIEPFMAKDQGESN